MDRNKYLGEYWPTYPSAPENCRDLRDLALAVKVTPPEGPRWYGGRVQGVDDSLVILADVWGNHLKLHNQHLSPVASGAGEWCKVLRSGDIVAVKLHSSKVTKVEGMCIYEGDLRAELVLLSIAQRQPMSLSVDPQRLVLWQRFLQTVRNYFSQHGFIEVNTPTLVVCPGMEPELEPFSTAFEMGRRWEQWFLPTSPELHMKKLLGQGLYPIFEIKSCFRNGEISAHHQPEFLMLEWYEAFVGLDSVQNHIQGLVEELRKHSMVVGEVSPLEVVTLPDLFKRHLGERLTPQTTYDELAAWAKERDVYLAGDETWNDLFHLLFLSFIEPKLIQYGPLILRKFPPQQAALARLDAEGWADRFEFYWRGLEIGNAFHELNHPDEQRRRFQQDIVTRYEKGRAKVPLDEEFLKTLDAGMPPSSGIAIGLERLFLACQNLQDLKQVRLFPKDE